MTAGGLMNNPHSNVLSPTATLDIITASVICAAWTALRIFSPACWPARAPANAKGIHTVQKTLEDGCLRNRELIVHFRFSSGVARQ